MPFQQALPAWCDAMQASLSAMAETLLKTQGWLCNREIAERVGFRDPDYFGKVFKKQIGCTMTEYRDRIK